MDDAWVGWETRLFRLEARAMGAGGYVSHEDALRQVLAHPLPCIVHAPAVQDCYRRCCQAHVPWLCNTVIGNAIGLMRPGCAGLL